MGQYWADLTWSEFAQLQKEGFETAILPIGTIEAHGVIPLGTDNMIPEAIARSIASPLKAFIAPTISYGITRSLGAYAGSLTVAPDTFEAYVRDVLISIASKGIKHIVVINGHGGQLDELKRAALHVHQKHGVKIIVIHWWILCQDLATSHFATEGGHAAVDETAAILAIAPNKVMKSDYDESMIYTVNPGANIYPIPSTILAYKPGSGELDFDSTKADNYFRDVCARVLSFVEEIFERWNKC